jgi:hypothetical protein
VRGLRPHGNSETDKAFAVCRHKNAPFKIVTLQSHQLRHQTDNRTVGAIPAWSPFAENI